MEVNRELLKKIGIGASRAILISLFLGAVLVAPKGVAGTLELIEKFFEGKKSRNYDAQQIKRALHYLKSRKLIDIQRQYEKEVFTLTKLGRLKTKKLVKSFGIKKPAKWDGLWRMVIFDIPHEKKSRREIFRGQLKKLGFANLQKSIWVHPYECRDQIFYLVKNLFIKPYVRYVVAREITGEEGLKKRFGL